MALTNDQITAQNFKDFYEQIYPFLGQGGGGGGSIADFTGATDQDDGAHGLVPAPQAGDEGKVLFGNGSWGNIVMPSVDLSVLSNEAFQFSTDEKPVGMWTDRKILYAKTIIKTGCSDGQTSVAHNIQNIDEICHVIAGVGNDELSTSGATSGTNRILFYVTKTNVDIMLSGGHSNETANITIFYTKTTDSPLASNEKFAGLTASGEVIYKKSGIFDNTDFESGKTWNYYTLLNLSDNITVRKIEGVVRITNFGVATIGTRAVLTDRTWETTFNYRKRIDFSCTNMHDVADPTIDITVYYTKPTS